jgi:oligoendopeptidase F
MKKVLATILLAATMSLQAYSQGGALPKRGDVAEKYKWNLTDFYKNDSEFESDYNKVKALIPKYKEFVGKLNNAESIAKCYAFHMETMKLFSRIYIYTALAKDADLNDGKSQTLNDRASKLGAEISAAASFIEPEILALPEAKVKEFVKTNKDLKQFEHTFDSMFRMKAHTLTKDQENILAMVAPIKEIPDDTYSMLNDAELPFPTTKDENGAEVRISHGRYRGALYSLDRSYRERVYKGTYVPYNQLKSTFATLYNGRVNTRMIESKVRKYDNVLEAFLYPNNIPVSVYENLVKTANNNLKSLHRWAGMKKKYLKLDELHPYDTYVTLFPGLNKSYTFEEGKELALKALAPMGEEYINTLKMCFDNRWIDVYETEGKRSGAYSNGCGCGVHPWILLNWNNTLDDVFTLVHELGHNMHSFFTEKHQPFHYADYSTFVAEVASTTNEAILLDYLIDHAQTKEEEAALIEKFLTNAQSTFFRQTRFAEFEKTIHEKAQKGEFLNADQLTDLFAKMYQKYWGPEMKTDYEEGLSWARIPHLYHYNLYVFQYATGFSAAQAFAEKIKNEGKPAIEKYLNNFIYAGNSVYPIDALRNAGVDMSTSAPIDKMIEKFNKYMDRLEKLMDKK